MKFILTKIYPNKEFLGRFDLYRKNQIRSRSILTHSIDEILTGLMIFTIKKKLEFKQSFNWPPEQTEDDDINTDSHVSDKLWRCVGWFMDSKPTTVLNFNKIAFQT